MKINIKTAFSLLVLIVLVLFSSLLWQLSRQYELAESMVVSVQPGSSLREIAYDLNERNIIDSPEILIIYFKLIGKGHAIHAGEYEFSGHLSLKKVTQILISGRVKQHSFTIVEGWHLDQLLQAIQDLKTDPDPSDRFLVDKQALSDYLKLPHAKPEGLFLPDTYFYTRSHKKIDILVRANRNMNKALTYLWQHKPRGLPYQSPYDALIVASLIEKETAVESERPLVASVIINRLYKNMPLQIDPTVIYGLNHKTQLTKTDLRTNTPYNTYIHRGLPPTPIALPSLDSLRAALFPEYTDYYYFVAKGDGTHVFSRTLAEQSKAIKRYILGRTS